MNKQNCKLWNLAAILNISAILEVVINDTSCPHLLSIILNILTGLKQQ